MQNNVLVPRLQRAGIDWRRAGTRAASTSDLESNSSSRLDPDAAGAPVLHPVRNTVRCDAAMWAQLEKHLRRSNVEEAAVLYASVERRADGITFTGDELELFQPTDFAYQSALHIELSESAQQRVIKRAWTLGCALIELHSHVDDRFVAAFSGSDLAGFEEFVPHVWWRLRGQPYAAMVMTPSGIDAMVWRDSPTAAEALEHVELITSSEHTDSPPTEILPSQATLTRRGLRTNDVTIYRQSAAVNRVGEVRGGGAS